MTSSSQAPTPTPPMVPAVLLKLRGIPETWKLYIGPDWASHVEGLSQHCPFPLEPLAIAPRTRPDPAAVALDAVQRFATPCYNGWFRAPASHAFLIFQAVLPDDLDAPVAPDATVPVVPDASDEPAAPMDVREPLDGLADTATPSFGDGPTAGDPELWQYVEPCTTREASKAIDIRTALTTRVGKHRAVELLSATRATVAKNAQGHNNRVLRANGALLRLRTGQ